MAAIDYGAIVRVNGKIVNRNKLFMDAPDFIADSGYAWAGDEYFHVVFNKHSVTLKYDGTSITVWPQFLSETVYAGDIDVKISYLDKAGYVGIAKSDYDIWSDYVRAYWSHANGNERLSELADGYREYKKFIRNKKWIYRYNKQKRTYHMSRWYVNWEYNGDRYECIFGYGVDPNEEVWRKCRDKYRFSSAENEIIDKWFSREW